MPGCLDKRIHECHHPCPAWLQIFFTNFPGRLEIIYVISWFIYNVGRVNNFHKFYSSLSYAQLEIRNFKKLLSTHDKIPHIPNYIGARVAQ